MEQIMQIIRDWGGLIAVLVTLSAAVRYIVRAENTRVEARLNHRIDETDHRITNLSNDIDRRFDNVDRRIESVRKELKADNRETNRRIDDIKNNDIAHLQLTQEYHAKILRSIAQYILSENKQAFAGELRNADEWYAQQQFNLRRQQVPAPDVPPADTEAEVVE